MNGSLRADLYDLQDDRCGICGVDDRGDLGVKHSELFGLDEVA